MSKSCRICGSVLSRTHYAIVALFSREFLASDLANRLSTVADVPVAYEDGLSRFICIPCKNILMSGEYLRTTANATYKKNKDPTLTASSAIASRGTVYGTVYKLSICFSGNGQRMRTNIVAIATRPSLFS